MAGRPSLPASEVKNNVLRIRLTLAERAALDRAARATGEDTSTWARSLLLAQAGRSPKPRRG